MVHFSIAIETTAYDSLSCSILKIFKAYKQLNATYDGETVASSNSSVS